MNFVKHLPIAWRFQAIVGVLAASLVVMLGLQLHGEYQSMVESRVAELKALVETGVNLAKTLHKAELDGKLSHEQAVKSFHDQITAMRYDGNNYLFVYRLDGIDIVQPSAPELEGTNRMGLRDPDGVMVVQDMLDVVKRGGGITRLE